MPAVVMTGVLREYHIDISLPHGHEDRVQWRSGRRRGRPEIAQMSICRNCNCPVFDNYPPCGVPREADGSPQTCGSCAGYLRWFGNKLPQPSNAGHRTWHELAFLYGVARLYLKEYKNAQRERRI
jgi:hypothetical protein